MKESYSEDLASHAGPELYADDGDVVGVATTGVHAGQPSSSDITCLVCRRSAAKRWSLESLPLIPVPFELKLTKDTRSRQQFRVAGKIASD